MPRPHDRMRFWVESDSRGELNGEHEVPPGFITSGPLEHLVDLEPFTYTDFESGREITDPATCTCEDFELGKARPCRHIEKLALWLVSRMELSFRNEIEARNRIKRTIKEIFK